MKLSNLTRSEDGWAVITAIIVLGVMTGLGLAAYAYSGGQTKLSRQEREKETSFNLAERALEQQTFKLSRGWAGSANGAYPPTCTPATTDDRCPNNGELISAADAPDTDTETTWTTFVRDNGDTDPTTANTGEDFYSSALFENRPSWDANKDNFLWVKSTSVVRGHTRSIVAKVKVETAPLPFPKKSIIANRLILGNNGNKTIVDTNGSNNGTVGGVELRCSSTAPTTCVESNGNKPYDPATDPRIQPADITSASSSSVLDSATLAQLLDTANANDTYHASCAGMSPTDFTGQVVYIKTVPVGGCSFSFNGGINSAGAPGVIVVEQSLGTLQIRGNTEFYGAMYFANTTNSSGTVLDMDGTIVIHGGIFVDGNGVVKAGQSGPGGQGDANVTFDPASLDLQSYGKAGIYQNSWREVR